MEKQFPELLIIDACIKYWSCFIRRLPITRSKQLFSEAIELTTYKVVSKNRCFFQKPLSCNNSDCVRDDIYTSEMNPIAISIYCCSEYVYSVEGTFEIKTLIFKACMFHHKTSKTVTLINNTNHNQPILECNHVCDILNTELSDHFLSFLLSRWNQMTSEGRRFHNS